MKLFFFDTETTGLRPETDRIIQFWAIFWTLDEKTGRFHEERIINQHIKIDEEIPQQASNVHHIYKKDLEPFGYIEDYIKEFVAYMTKADYLIGHNVEYDRRMFMGEIMRCGSVGFNSDDHKRFDTMTSTAELVNGPGGRRPRLSQLYRFLFGRDFDNAHDAMADIVATKDCFLALDRTWKITLPK